MNKNNVIFTLILILFISCQRKETKKVYEKPDYLEYDSFWRIDTLAHNDIYNADTISFHDFYSAEEYNLDDIETIDDRDFVKRTDSLLIFKLKNGKKKILENSKKKYTNFFYLREIPDVNCWLVQGLHNDDHQYNFLVNKNTGIETPIANLPIISPNKKYMVSFSELCTNEGLIQFFRIERDSLSKLWLKIFSNDITPKGIRWKNDSTLFIEMDSACMRERNPKYIELTVGRYMK